MAIAPRAKCGAKTRAGTPCRSPVVAGRSRCRMHGGASRRGIESGTFKHGKYSKYLPDRLLETYQIAGQDSELLGMREEITVLDSRLVDLLKRVDSGEAGAAWRDAKEIYADIVDALRNQDAAGLRAAVQRLGTTLNRGDRDYLAWQEVRQVMQERKALVESERRRMIEDRQMITVESALVAIQAITHAAREILADQPERLGRLQSRISTILGVAEGGAGSRSAGERDVPGALPG